MTDVLIEKNSEDSNVESVDQSQPQSDDKNTVQTDLKAFPTPGFQDPYMQPILYGPIMGHESYGFMYGPPMLPYQSPMVSAYHSMPMSVHHTQQVPSLVQHLPVYHHNQNNSIILNDDGSNNEAVVPEKQSWAQITRKPGNEPVAGNEKKVKNSTHNQQEGSNSNVINSSWTIRVKEQVRCFSDAQCLFFNSQLYQTDPFFLLSTSYNLPVDIYHMLHQGICLPPEYEHIESTAKYLRLICSVNFLAWINLEQELPKGVIEYYMIDCKDEMQVYQYIKHSSLVIKSKDVERQLSESFAAVNGLGSVLLFFTISKLRKLVGCALMFSDVTYFEHEPEKVIPLRWIYVRDIFYVSVNKYVNDVELFNSLCKNDKPNINDTAHPPKQPEQKSDVNDQNNQDELNPSSSDIKQDQDIQDESHNFIKISTDTGAAIYKVFHQYIRNGGILLDFNEYALAESLNIKPIQANLLCGGLRLRSKSPFDKNISDDTKEKYFGSNKNYSQGAQSGMYDFPSKFLNSKNENTLGNNNENMKGNNKEKINEQNLLERNNRSGIRGPRNVRYKNRNNQSKQNHNNSGNFNPNDEKKNRDKSNKKNDVTNDSFRSRRRNTGVVSKKETSRKVESSSGASLVLDKRYTFDILAKKKSSKHKDNSGPKP